MIAATADWRMKEVEVPEPGKTIQLGHDMAIRNEGGELAFYAWDSTILHTVIRTLGVDPDDQKAISQTARWQPISLLPRMMEEMDDLIRNGVLEARLLRNWYDFRTNMTPARRQRIHEGLVTWDELPLVFHKGVEVVMDLVDGEKAAGTVGTCLPCGGGKSPLHYHVRVEFLHHFGAMEPAKGGIEYLVPFYEGERPLSTQKIRMLDANTKQEFTERGRKIRDLVAKPTLAVFDRHMLVPGMFGSVSRKWARGRVMVDPGGMSVHATDEMRYFAGTVTVDDRDEYNEDRHGGGIFSLGLGGEEEDKNRRSVEDDSLWKIWPFLPFYSFRLRRWGVGTVVGLTLPEYRSDAYDKLVLDPQTKETLRTLVEHHEGTFKDLVEDKSGGLVILLPGGTGIGKTLTVEALADGVKRPLYSVSVGELGDNAQSIEHQFQMAMELAERWHAVLLLDEADLFLEEREKGQVERNAIVSTFLRLLDKHNGILFLTTNRTVNLDAAVQSRISASIPYPDLDEGARRQVWNNLLSAAGAGDWVQDVLDELSLRQMNGRQIRSAIRLAQTLGKGKGEELSLSHLHDALRLVNRSG